MGTPNAEPISSSVNVNQPNITNPIQLPWTLQMSSRCCHAILLGLLDDQGRHCVRLPLK